MSSTSQRTPVPAPAVDATRCPLCGGPNDCARCGQPGTSPPFACWCESEVIPPALLERVPLALRDRACVCRGCVQRFHAATTGAFTLVELLVSIALIALLAALLLPALARGKDSARRVRCVSNLHQLGLATQMYWDDHAGEAFRYGGTATNGGQLYWFGWISGGAEGQRTFDAAPGALHPYLLGRGIELCPSLNYALSQFKFKATTAAYGYGYNLHLSTPASRPAFRITTLRQPAQAVLFADAAQVNIFQPPASRSNPMLEEFYYVSTNLNEATAHFRHNERAGAAFADGHVAPERLAPGSLDRHLPAQNVARLRPEILAVP